MLKEIFFKELGGELQVAIEFDGAMNAAYSLKVSEKNSNAAVLFKDGDNLNVEDDAYTLPDAAKENDGRIIRLITDFSAREPGASSAYEIRISLRQGQTVLDHNLETGMLTGNLQSSMLFVKLVMEL